MSHVAKAIVIVPNDGADDYHFGPFANSVEACRWASDKFGIATCWHWLPLFTPETSLADAAIVTDAVEG